MTVYDIKLKIFGLLKSLLNLPSLSKTNLKGQKLGSNQYLTKEFNYLFINPSSGKYDKENEFYDVLILNNLPIDPKTKQPVECEFCNTSHTNNCMFTFDKDELTLQQILGQIKHTRELELVISWKSSTKADL